MPETRSTADPSITPLIEPAELTARLAAAGRADSPVLLDVRWSLAGSDRAGYLTAHLPGAVFVDLDRDLAAAPGAGGRHPLPEPEVLQQLWRAAGIDDSSHVVVYDGGNGLGAARAWWLLRWSGLTTVQVLDGGLPAWRADPARRLDHGEPARRTLGSMTVVAGAMPVVDADGAAAVAAAPDGVLLDARARERFRGEVEPLDPVAGHIPGSVNLPIGQLLTEAGTYRPADELATALRRAGVSGASDPSADAAPADTARADTARADTARADTARADTTHGPRRPAAPG